MIRHGRDSTGFLRDDVRMILGFAITLATGGGQVGAKPDGVDTIQA